MKIENYQVQQNSTHSLTKSRSETESLEVWANGQQAGQDERSYIVDINRSTFEFSTQKASLSSEAQTANELKTDTRIRLLESLVYQLTGKRISFKVPDPDLLKSDAPELNLGSIDGRSPTEESRGWGLVYEYQEIVTEQESVTFSSSGYVTTADGRTIAFNLDFEMSRAFYQQTNLSIRMGDAAKMVDPLVVVFGSGAPTLSASKHDFDLDMDGKADSISFATGNSGFLALDKNGDGVINDGSELFGPQSGNGFLDLSKYDTDKNGWIDEADEIFGQLMILTLSQDGEKTLFKLGDLGIGAIYLNAVSTQFSLKDGADTHGEMKSSSVFLRENGTAGTIHHIDLSL